MSVILHKFKGIFKGKTRKKLPEHYFKRVYLNEKQFTGIEIVAKSEGISRVKANQMILDMGFKVYYANKLQEHNEEKKRRAEMNVKQYPTRFIRALKKNAKPEDKNILKKL